MSDVLLSLILIGLGFAVGWHIRTLVLMARLSTQPEKMIEILNKIKQINDKEKDMPEELKGVDGDELVIERVGNQLYAFTKENDEFIAQGPDLTTLLETAKKRFPNRTFFGNISRDSDAKELAVKN